MCQGRRGGRQPESWKQWSFRFQGTAKVLSTAFMAKHGCRIIQCVANTVFPKYTEKKQETSDLILV